MKIHYLIQQIFIEPLKSAGTFLDAVDIEVNQTGRFSGPILPETERHRQITNYIIYRLVISAIYEERQSG